MIKHVYNQLVKRYFEVKLLIKIGGSTSSADREKYMQ